MNFYSSPSTEITRGSTEGIGGLAGIDDNVRERGPEEKCFQTLAEGRWYCRSGQWRRQDFVTGGSEVWVYWGSRVRSPPEADTFTAVHGEFVGFGTV